MQIRMNNQKAYNRLAWLLKDTTNSLSFPTILPPKIPSKFNPGANEWIVYYMVIKMRIQLIHIGRNRRPFFRNDKILNTSALYGRVARRARNASLNSTFPSSVYIVYGCFCNIYMCTRSLISSCIIDMCVIVSVFD